MTEVPPVLPEVDTSRPSAARIYDFMLGGCHNFPVDREAAAKVIDVVPEFTEIAWANRGFHQRRAIARFFDGLDLVPPFHGAAAEVAHLGLWGCEDPGLADSDSSRWGYCGVARVR